MCSDAYLTESGKECTLNQPGTYTVWISSYYANQIGTFALYVARLSAPTTQPPTAITYGDIVSGNIDGMRWYPYTFTGAAGERVLIRVRETAGDITPYMSLRGPDGSTCNEYSSTEFDRECVLSASGTYTIWMHTVYGYESGGFSMYLARMSPSPTQPATAVAYGDIASGSINGMRWYPYTFTGAVGERILVRVRETSGDITPYMSLRRPDGSTLCTAYSSTEFDDECVLNVSGTYTIWMHTVYGYQTGTFDLYLARLSAPTVPASTAISNDVVVSRNLGQMEWVPYTFQGTAGEVVTVSLSETIGDLYPRMSLRRTDGSVLCTGSHPTAFTKTCTLDASGIHTIWVYSNSGSESGGFSLSYTSSLHATPTPTATPTAVPTATPTPTLTTVPTATPTLPSGTIWETLGGSYANAAPCSGTTGDPIGTVFLLAGADATAATDLANTWLNDIGMTSGYGPFPPPLPSFTNRDNFLDNGGCVEGDITRATNDGFELCFDFLGNPCGYYIVSRWHTRCIVHAQPSAYGYWASCTPHWDSGPPPSCPSHYVPEVYNGPDNFPGLSGYDAARDWLHYELVQQHGMTFVGPVHFENFADRSQCGGTMVSFADGKVNVIALQ